LAAADSREPSVSRVSQGSGGGKGEHEGGGEEQARDAADDVVEIEADLIVERQQLSLLCPLSCQRCAAPTGRPRELLWRRPAPARACTKARPCLEARPCLALVLPPDTCWVSQDQCPGQRSRVHALAGHPCCPVLSGCPAFELGQRSRHGCQRGVMGAGLLLTLTDVVRLLWAVLRQGHVVRLCGEQHAAAAPRRSWRHCQRRAACGAEMPLVQKGYENAGARRALLGAARQVQHGLGAGRRRLEFAPVGRFGLKMQGRAVFESLAADCPPLADGRLSPPCPFGKLGTPKKLLNS